MCFLAPTKCPTILLLLLLRSSCRIVSCHLQLIIYSSGQLAVGSPIELMGTVTVQEREVKICGEGMGDRLQSSDIVCHLGLLN